MARKSNIYQEEDQHSDPRYATKQRNNRSFVGNMWVWITVSHWVTYIVITIIFISKCFLIKKIWDWDEDTLRIKVT